MEGKGKRLCWTRRRAKLGQRSHELFLPTTHDPGNLRKQLCARDGHGRQNSAARQAISSQFGKWKKVRRNQDTSVKGSTVMLIEGTNTFGCRRKMEEIQLGK